MSQLRALCEPFSGRYIKTKPGPSKAAYVEHSDITQRLLHVVGPYSFEVVEVVRGDVAPTVDKQTGEIKKPGQPDVVVGCVARLTCEIDGRQVSVAEVGEVEHPLNHSQDGSRLKFAASDAIKRCAMRLGLGLHLWCQDHYYLSADKVWQDDA